MVFLLNSPFYYNKYEMPNKALKKISQFMISYTLCNEDNYYTIKKTLPETEGLDTDNGGVNHAGTL